MGETTNSTQHTLTSMESYDRGSDEVISASYTLKSGDEVQILGAESPEGEPLIRITQEPGSDGAFVVDKKVDTTNRTLVTVAEANRWALEASRAQIKSGSPLSGILLGPSLVGSTLFGAGKSPGQDVEDRFGTITIERTPFSEGPELMVTMPRTDFGGVGKLVIRKVNTAVKS